MFSANESMISNSTTTAGADGCPCIDTSTFLESLVERSCTTADGQDGVLITVSGPCVKYEFGSSKCFPHELNVDLKCMVPESGDTSGIPEYCSRSWCYVDAMTCMVSDERLKRSWLFEADSGVDMHYSYSTCGASESDWSDNTKVALDGVSMKGITAAYNLKPWMYKPDYNGDVNIVPGPEYYDIDLPYEGVHANFVKSLQDIADGDFTVDMVYGSGASKKMHPSSAGTASVQDVADGLVDIAIGPFWITGERLKLTSFTMPIMIDETVLVIPQPGTKSSLKMQTQKVLDPFSWTVWALLIGTVSVTAILSVWFSSDKRNQGGRKGRTRKRVYTRLCLDEFLQKGTFFCSAGVEQDHGASLPQKLLLFGFAFFTLILVSAYVANLAAFLTRAVPTDVRDIESAVARGAKICAHPALLADLRLAHPDAKFVINKDGGEFYGMVDDYVEGNCEVMAVSKMDTLGDLDLMDLFCEKGLVYTESVIIENSVGFPIRDELASGFSYWMYQAEKYHAVTVESTQEDYNQEMKRQLSCNVILSEQNDEPNDYAEITAATLFFPMMFFLAFAGLAVLLQLYHYWIMKGNKNDAINSRRSLVGRASTLDLFADTRNAGNSPQAKYDDDEEDDEEEEDFGVQRPQLGNGTISNLKPQLKKAASIARGTITLDTVHIDDFDDDEVNSNGRHTTTLSQMDPGVLDKLHELFDCYETMKTRKMTPSN